MNLNSHIISIVFLLHMHPTSHDDQEQYKGEMRILLLSQILRDLPSQTNLYLSLVATYGRDDHFAYQ